MRSPHGLYMSTQALTLASSAANSEFPSTGQVEHAVVYSEIENSKATNTQSTTEEPKEMS